MDCITKGSSHQLLIQTCLHGRYRIKGVLGEGGFGITYLCFDETLQQQVAVKEFFPRTLVSRYSKESSGVMLLGEAAAVSYERGKQRFLEEARTLVQFRDEPNILSVFDFFEENGTAYIVMEYLEGEDILSLIERRGHIPAEETVQMMQPLFTALEKMHAVGLLHRDISPSNIRILPDKQIKLLDFGASRSIEYESGGTRSMISKPGYSPLEQYMHMDQGPWIDVYAICATMYHMITGIIPDDALQRILLDELQKPSELGVKIAPEVEAVLWKGLSVDYHERYQTITGLKDAFAEALYESGEEVVIDQTARKKKHRLVFTLAGIAAAIAVIAAAIVVLPKVLTRNTDPGNVTTEEIAVASIEETTEITSVEEKTTEERITENENTTEDHYYENGIAWNFSDGVLTFFGTGEIPDVEVVLEEGTVQSRRGCPWDDVRNQVVSVILEDGITGIGKHAFSYCEALEMVAIPNSVSSIGAAAFASCPRLKEINIPDRVEVIEPETFRDCNMLAELFLPATIKEIRDKAFDGCDSLKNTFFLGSERQWDAVAFADGNNAVSDAEMHFGLEEAMWTQWMIDRVKEGTEIRLPDILSHFSIYHYSGVILICKNGYDEIIQAEDIQKVAFYYDEENGIIFDSVEFPGYQLADVVTIKIMPPEAVRITAQELGLSNISVGEYIKFGAYEQDGIQENGYEELEWLVLAREGDKALIITRNIVDYYSYNTADTIITWETCSLREWLGLFLGDFSADERQFIEYTVVKAENNPQYNTAAGNDTTDRAFLLSYAEVKQYFHSIDARIAVPTAYAKYLAETYSYYEFEEDYETLLKWWWLRTPGEQENLAMYVDDIGVIFTRGIWINDGLIGVRPAMWINVGN